MRCARPMAARQWPMYAASSGGSTGTLYSSAKSDSAVSQLASLVIAEFQKIMKCYRLDLPGCSAGDESLPVYRSFEQLIDTRFTITREGSATEQR